MLSVPGQRTDCVHPKPSHTGYQAQFQQAPKSTCMLIGCSMSCRLCCVLPPGSWVPSQRRDHAAHLAHLAPSHVLEADPRLLLQGEGKDVIHQLLAAMTREAMSAGVGATGCRLQP